MQLRPSSADGVVVLAVDGDLAAQHADHLVAAVQASWPDAPRGVVVDLQGVTSLPSQVGDALRGLAERVRPWPHPSLLVCSLPAGAELPGLPVHRDRAEALRHVDDRPDVPRERIRLPFGPRGPGHARTAVAACARRFGLHDLLDDLELVVSEMVTNAVKHAHAPVILEVHADDTGVLLAVADGSPHAPVTRSADEDAEGGRGLLLVDLLAAEHGVRPDPPGKTVWAALPARRGPA